MTAAPAQLSSDLAGSPVLGLPRDTDVLALAGAWFPHARWERPPVTAAQVRSLARPAAGARFRGVTTEEVAEPGVLWLSPGVVLRGPYPLDVPASAAGAGCQVPRTLDGYGVAVDAPDAPAVLHPDGWVVAAARHSGGVVVDVDRSRTWTFDPRAAVDLTLWSAVALPLDVLVRLVRPRLPGARVSVTPAAVPGSVIAPYELLARFDYDGDVRLGFSRPAQVATVLERVSWRDHGPFAYAVRWAPPEPDELLVAQPSTPHVIARGRIAPLVAHAVAALMPAVGGAVVDDGGFLVGPAELAARALGRTR